jgi:hypothetical protein
MFNQEWQIKTRSNACKLCSKPFANNQVYVSSLRLNGQDFERTDCCEECWNKASQTGGFFSVWRGTFQVIAPPPEVLKKETAESLLRKLIEKNEPQHRNVIFILAVMLERRKILSEKEVKKDENLSLIRVYEHRQTGETFIITDPMLALDQLGALHEEISALLSGGETTTTAPQNNV